MTQTFKPTLKFISKTSEKDKKTKAWRLFKTQEDLDKLNLSENSSIEAKKMYFNAYPCVFDIPDIIKLVTIESSMCLINSTAEIMTISKSDLIIRLARFPFLKTLEQSQCESRKYVPEKFIVKFDGVEQADLSFQVVIVNCSRQKKQGVKVTDRKRKVSKGTGLKRKNDDDGAGFKKKSKRRNWFNFYNFQTWRN